MSAVCPVCGKRVRIRVPRGGDGSMMTFYRHDDQTGALCDGAWTEAPYGGDELEPDKTTNPTVGSSDAATHDHWNRCCTEHDTHTTPHKGCILR